MTITISPGLSAVVQASRKFPSPKHSPGEYARAALESARISGRIRRDTAGVEFAAVRADVARSLFDLGCRVRIQCGGRAIPSRCQCGHKSATTFTAWVDLAVVRFGAKIVYLVPVADLEGLANV